MPADSRIPRGRTLELHVGGRERSRWGPAGLVLRVGGRRGVVTGHQVWWDGYMRSEKVGSSMAHGPRRPVGRGGHGGPLPRGGGRSRHRHLVIAPALGVGPAVTDWGTVPMVKATSIPAARTKLSRCMDSGTTLGHECCGRAGDGTKGNHTPPGDSLSHAQRGALSRYQMGMVQQTVHRRGGEGLGHDGVET